MGTGFSERLKHLREMKRPVKSRNKTADFIGISHESLRKYERGEATPRIDVAALIADYYGVSIDYLWHGK